MLAESYTTAGLSTPQVIDVDPDDPVAAVVAVHEFSDDSYLVLLTKQGSIKKTPLSAFKSVRKNGLPVRGKQSFVA